MTSILDAHSSTGVGKLALLFVFVIAAPFARTETARRAEDFVESIGINTHLSDASHYFGHSVFGGLGVRYFRHNTPPDPFNEGYARMAGLYNSFGIRFMMACDRTEYSVAQRQDMMKRVVYEPIEGLNEPDLFGPRTYWHKFFTTF